jgi:hypothetical protein
MPPERSNEERPPLNVEHLWRQVLEIAQYLKANVWRRQ